MNGELYHYGVKGMKWGVRKKNYNSSTMDQDRIIKKGIVDKLTTNQYGQAKKELQRVEAKQQIKDTYIRE